MASKTSQLIGDLRTVPSIVGSLGLSIAEAQKAFNLDYLESLGQLVTMIRSILGVKTLDAESRTFLESMLTRLAPPSYQFTETTLDVRLDLAQSQRVGGQGEVGGTLGAVTVSASVAAAYGLDYRAAAHCRTVIQARSLDPAAMTALFGRVKELDAQKLELPADTPRIDKEIFQAAQGVAKQLGGGASELDETPEKPETPAPPAGETTTGQTTTES